MLKIHTVYVQVSPRKCSQITTSVHSLVHAHPMNEIFTSVHASSSLGVTPGWSLKRVTLFH